MLIIPQKITLLYFTTIIFASLSCFASPHINVIYPKDGQRVVARDITYIMGTIEPKDAKLYINGTEIAVYHTGAFLAVLPVKKGIFPFKCRIVKDGKTLSELTRTVNITHWTPKPITTKNIIEKSTLLPASNIGITLGETILFSCKTKPSCKVVCVIKDGKKSIEFPLFDKYGGGIYKAEHTFNEEIHSASIVYKVLNNTNIPSVKSDAVITVQNVDKYPVYIVNTPIMEMKARDRASYNGNYTSFLTQGSVLQSSGFNGKWTRLLQDNETQVYVRTSQLTKLISKKLITKNVLTDIIVTESSEKVVAYLRGINIANVKWLQFPAERKLGIKLFKTSISDCGEVLVTKNSRVTDIKKIMGLDSCELVFKLDFEPDWGFDIQYKNGYGIVTINKPLTENKQRPITVCIDPGHGGDELGAVGPSGLMEKNANLAMCQTLKKRLIGSGFNVIMTRDEDIKVPIYDRHRFAHRNRADLFISIHYNACPDGTDPFKRRGLELYYYYDSGKYFASFIHNELKRVSKIKDNGLAFKSLVVCRDYTIPSCLIELDYISIPEAEATIMTDEYRERISSAIVLALNKYLGRDLNGK